MIDVSSTKYILSPEFDRNKCQGEAEEKGQSDKASSQGKQSWRRALKKWENILAGENALVFRAARDLFDPVPLPSFIRKQEIKLTCYSGISYFRA